MIINDHFYNNLIANLRQSVPDFSFDESDEPYLIMFEFAQFMIGNMEKDHSLQECCLFINQAVQEGLEETRTVLILQVFQPLYYQNFHMQRCKEYFLPETNVLFDNYYLEFLKDYKPGA